MRWAVAVVVVGYVVVRWANARTAEHNTRTGRVAGQPLWGVSAGRIGRGRNAANVPATDRTAPTKDEVQP